jgi:uncharacterized membrane-anchored protein
MMTKRTKFILAGALQVAIIAAMIIVKMAILGNGTEVLLPIMPVDPRDMLRGDYIDLSYRISNIPSYMQEGQPYKSGETVYVVLRPTEGKSFAEKIQKTKPTAETIFIKGRVVSNYGSLNVKYGIEQYFIPEGKGQRINSAITNNSVAVVVIDSNGNAVLKHLLVNNKIWP